MPMLDRKLLRDIRRLWAQALAIAFVVAGGVTSIVLAAGSLRSLEETRAAYYERYQFADVFALLTRAPKSLLSQIAEIPGVAAVEGRIAKLALLDIPDFQEPATGQFLSVPDTDQPRLNQLYMRMGRTPDLSKPEEVVINDGFAKAHKFKLGDRFHAILNGRKRELVIVGIALSPEFIFTIGPGDQMPDERRFAIVWMPEKTLANVYNLEGAFSSVSLKLLRGTSEQEVIKRLDTLLDRYGGQAAYGRANQTSDAYIDHGFEMLKSMRGTLPPIFLLVAGFLVNLTLSRIVALEREQIGLLKALGYRNATIALHYLKFVTIIVTIGIIIGGVGGTWLGSYVTQLYGDYFRFPFLVFAHSPDLYALAAMLSLVAAIIGTMRALKEIMTLTPAIAMQPPAPPRVHRLLPAAWNIHKVISQPGIMMLRNISAHPLRALFATLGIAFATGILIGSLFLNDAIEALIEVTYFMADRQDATISFVERRPINAVEQVKRLPGVLAVEPYRDVPIRIRYGNIEKRVLLSGRPREADLRRLIDVDLRPVSLPENGLAISAWLGKILGVQVGDIVEIDLLEGQRRTVSVSVTALIEDYYGIQGMMVAQSLGRLMREAPSVTTVNVSLDRRAQDQFYQAIKGLPTVSGMALQRVSLVNFREQIVILVTTMVSIYAGLAAVIAFGVVYNSARISLSERARELASLRVLGFTRAEVMRILLLELTVLTLLAQPPGWAIGYGLSWIMKTNSEGEVMRVRMVIENTTYCLASGIIIVAALLSALVIRERINRLDLVSVLKTRD
ncbi:MAG TPA: FtsX-like permease family protein [Xanthobacteraceae bacterium]|nr:FtsX-like permease family protein [Xanthobacteraceae bacterium]